MSHLLFERLRENLEGATEPSKDHLMGEVVQDEVGRRKEGAKAV